VKAWKYGSMEVWKQGSKKVNLKLKIVVEVSS
jgi:ribosomal protein L31E